MGIINLRYNGIYLLEEWPLEGRPLAIDGLWWKSCPNHFDGWLVKDSVWLEWMENLKGNMWSKVSIMILRWYAAIGCCLALCKTMWSRLDSHTCRQNIFYGIQRMPKPSSKQIASRLRWWTLPQPPRKIHHPSSSTVELVSRGNSWVWWAILLLLKMAHL